MTEQLNDYIMENLDRVYRFAYNRLRNEYNAEDMTQDIILTAMRNVGNIKDSSKLEAWFWGVARNVYMQSLKPKREVPTEESMIIDISGIHYTTPESEYMKNVDTSNVRRAISYLGRMYRDVAVLYYIDEKDYTTIAEELSIPLSSVKWRLNQSKIQLKEELVKMDTKYMANGYRKAVDYNLNMGGVTRGKSERKGAANKALETLLAKNICLSAYESPKTITEIANDLGTSADYIEYHVEQLVNSEAMTQTSNKYQTNFPIINEQQHIELMQATYKAASKDSGKVLDKIYELKDEIIKLDFGYVKDFDNLLLLLTSTIADNTAENIFDVDNLPFKDIDETWYILGTAKECRHGLKLEGGINWCDNYGIKEYGINTEPGYVNINSDDIETVSKILNSTLIEDDKTKEVLARLIEQGKIIKSGERYIISIPVISKEDYEKLLTILQPAIEIANKIQQDILTESNKLVKKYIPSRLNLELFFTRYFAHCMINASLMNAITDKGIEITRDMVMWYLLLGNVGGNKLVQNGET